jgi:CHAP domain
MDKEREMPEAAVFDPERALAVTTPRLTGQDVRLAQRALKHNRFDDFLQGEVDDDWGPECRRATLRAKEAIGYRRTLWTPTYGATLHSYLMGEELTNAMKERRERFILDERKDLRLRALRVAKDQIGTKEHPDGSNKTKYGEWYEVNGVFWCAIFVSWCFNKAGSEVFKPAKRHSYVPNIMGYAIAREHGLDQIRHPQPGDMVLYQFDDNINSDHIGIFEEWEEEGSTFTTIEGNTSSTSFSNGGHVMRQHRNMDHVYRPGTGGRGFVRVLN